MWVLADSTNGYFSRMEIYTGKKGSTIEHNLGCRVMKELTSDFQNKWHHVFLTTFSPRRPSYAILRLWACMGVGQPERIGSIFQ